MIETPDIFRAKLLEVCNNAWREGKFPTPWKIALINPIVKPGKPPEDPVSYRPISVLPTMGKIFEQMILRRLEWFAEVNQIIPQSQTCFRKSHSAMDNITRIDTDMTDALQEGEVGIAVLFDWTYAYGNVKCKKLQEIMHSKNFRPLVISIIKNLLYDCSFQVQINEILSVRKQVEDGLPQRTVISPLLFTLYISELKLRSQSKQGEFADNLLVWNRHKNITLLQNIIQEDIYDVCLFSKAFGLPISIPKTKAIVFHKRQVTPPIPLRIEESDIVYEPFYQFGYWA